MRRTVSNAPGCAPDIAPFDPRTDDFEVKERNYAHFDLRLSDGERKNFCFDEHKLERHAFFPLLGFNKVERKLKVDPIHGKFFVEKPRKIKFGSHFDAAVMQWYSRRLSERYEEYLNRSNFSDCVLAYRSGVGDNVTQAKELFDEISNRGNVLAVAMDIKGFFDNISHAALHQAIKAILCTDYLKKHDQRVYETMTKFAWVDVDRLAERLGRKRPVGGRWCSIHEFRTKVRKSGDSIIERNLSNVGIPQGSPLSGLYANIVMIDFDNAMQSYARALGGSYRRYSDDLAFLLPPDSDVSSLLKAVDDQLKNLGLWLNTDKTEISEFQLHRERQTSLRPFQYLGFTFDGERRLVRSSSINRYYKKMHRKVRAKIRAAKAKEVPRNQIYMRELYKSFTHFGKGRNFPQYVYRASRIMNAPEMRAQIKPHMKKFKNAVSDAVIRVYGS